MTNSTLTQSFRNVEMEDNNKEKISILSLFLIFLKIGSLAFGGYMALISVIENTIVRRHGLISHQDMLNGISLANLLPGPMAVNVVAFVGYKIHGRIGAFITTTAVILPSFILILALSYIYFNYGEILNFSSIFLGFMPAVAAIIFNVAWRLSKKTLTGNNELLIALFAIMTLLFIPIEYKVFTPIFLILLSGCVGYFIFNERPSIPVSKASNRSQRKSPLVLFLFAGLILLWFLPLPLDKNSTLFLTLTFASMSLMLFGGGYVFIPVIGSIVVLEHGWLSSQQFTDGIALGQVTPGPILISATFIGYKVAGFFGALFSTIAIFGVPALLMVVVSRWFDFISQSATTKAVMHGIHSAVIGMITVAAFIILKSAFGSFDIVHVAMNWPLVLIFFLSLIGLIKYNLDVIWIIPPAGFLGYTFL